MSLATIKTISNLLVKFERGLKSLRSVHFGRSVKLLTVRLEEFTVRKLHVISDTSNSFDFAGKVREGCNIITVRTVSTDRKVVNGSSRRVYGPLVACH